MQVHGMLQARKFLPGKVLAAAACAQRGMSTKNTSLHLDAIYMARSLNLVELSKHISRKWPEGTYSCKVERDWAFFWIDHTSYHSHHARVDAEPAFPAMMAVSRRGSLVRVNADGSSPDHDMEAAVQHAVTAPLPAGTKRPHEEMKILLSPAAGAPAHAAFNRGALHLTALDRDCERIIASCMAQTVNLAFFESAVDALHDVAAEVNRSLDRDMEAASGSWYSALFGGTTRHLLGGHDTSTSALYRRLGEINDISNQIVLSGLRSTVRPGSTAWKEERYAQLQEALVDELDLQERYTELQRKLEYVTEAIKYALETSKSNTSLFLERVIVLLISAELALSTIAADLPGKAFRGLAALLS